METRMKSLVAGCLAALSVPAGASSGRVMSLGELFSLADSRSKTIKLMEAAVEVAGHDVSVAGNALLPAIDFSGWQTFVSPHFGNSFSVEASQVVFAGGSVHFNIKALEIQKEIAECELESHRQ